MLIPFQLSELYDQCRNHKWVQILIFFFYFKQQFWTIIEIKSVPRIQSVEICSVLETAKHDVYFDIVYI